MTDSAIQYPPPPPPRPHAPLHIHPVPPHPPPPRQTLAWEPFLAQTLAMVRDRQHAYRRGPGYVEGTTERGEKGVLEQYWEVEGPVPPGQEPAPYRVELVGVYVRPEVAVRRGIIRRLLTGRGVPVRDQLRSHALFAKNFEAFACCFDTVRCWREAGWCV